MITLDVQPYCQNCENFEPVKESASMQFFDGGHIGLITETTVKCKYRYKCDEIYRHIEASMWLEKNKEKTE